MYQVMSVNSGATLSIDELTIAHGSSVSFGGGILNAGTLMASDCTFSGNSAGGGGGAIENKGMATITSSMFSGNSVVGVGGAIDQDSNDPLTVTNSSFSSGSASDGGAVYGFGSGTFTNSTFSKNNTVVGGAIYGSGTFTNCTFSGNSARVGGAIFNLAISKLKSTILTSSPSGGDCGDSAVTDDGYNLSDDDSCAFSATGSQNNVTGLALGPLMNNGGLTDTFAITSSSSPAAATIPAASCTDLASPPNPLITGQRGYGRPVAGACSARAYQLGGPPPGALIVMPTSLSFPDTFVGAKSTEKQVTVENTSAVSVDLHSITVGTANFAVDSSQCTSRLPRA